MATSPGNQQGCSKCNETKKKSTKPLFPIDIIAGTVGNDRSNKAKYIEEFLEAMNALLNEGGGVLYIHCENLCKLNLFDELVDDKLKNLIPDGTPFAENFERYVLDEKHVAFEVLHRNRQGLLSTLKCNSKVSMNKGLGDPSQMEIKYYVTKDYPSAVGATAGHSGHAPSSGGREISGPHSGNLEYDKPVFLNGFPFQESTSTQAKRVIDSELPVAGFCWENLHLPNYISAFSKLKDGGSVYFGITEEKKTERNKEIKTGIVRCEGVQLCKGERDNIKKEFQRLVREGMMWLANADPQDPISVKFHDVTGGNPELCVIEVVVECLEGVSFFEKIGPQAYRLKRNKPSVIPVGDWVACLAGKLKETVPCFSQVT